MTSREQPTNETNETKCKDCGHVHRGKDFCTQDFNCLCPSVPTVVPLEAREHEAREWFKKITIDDVGIADAQDLNIFKMREWLPKVLVAYSSHVNAALMDSVAWWKNHAALALKEREAAESRISALERERDAIVDALLLERGDDPGEYFVPAEPEPQGPYELVQAVKQLIHFRDKWEREDEARAELAESQLSTTQEALRKIVQVSDELTGQTRLVDNIGFYEMNETLEEMTQIAERVLSPPTKLDG